MLHDRLPSYPALYPPKTNGISIRDTFHHISCPDTSQIRAPMLPYDNIQYTVSLRFVSQTNSQAHCDRSQRHTSKTWLADLQGEQPIDSRKEQLHNLQVLCLTLQK